MRRREYLSAIGTSLITKTVLGRTATTLQSSNAPSIPSETLNRYGWERVKDPQFPNDIELDHGFESLSWELSQFNDAHLDTIISEQVDSDLPAHYMSIFAVRIAGMSYIIPRSGISGEFLSDIDGDAEAVLEELINNQSDIELGQEYHIPLFQEAAAGIVGQFPVAGDAVSILLNQLWDTPASITTRHGTDAGLSQYLSSRLLSVRETDIEVDYRTLYADWFHDEDFYAVMGIYPEDAETLVEAIEEATGASISIKPDQEFEREILRLIRDVG